jgi:type IV pilus assembly protein PilM
MMVEIGSTTTDISIIDKSIPMLNRSIDVGGYAITKSITEHLQVEPAKAEQFKYDLGISHIGSESEEVPKAIIETISPIVNEIKYAMNLFESKYGKKTEKIVLSGGSSLLPNLAKYLSNLMNINVIVGDPWTRVRYPEDLRPLLNEIGPRLSIAIGLAMRELE